MRSTRVRTAGQDGDLDPQPEPGQRDRREPEPDAAPPRAVHARRSPTTPPPRRCRNWSRASRNSCAPTQGVDPEQIMVRFTEFGASSLDIMVQYFTITTEYPRSLEVRQRVNLALMQLVEEMGLQFAYPTRTVHLVGGGGDGRPQAAGERLGRAFRVLPGPAASRIAPPSYILLSPDRRAGPPRRPGRTGEPPARSARHDPVATRFPEDHGPGRRHRRGRRRPESRRPPAPISPPCAASAAEDPDPGRHRLPGPVGGARSARPRPRDHAVQPRPHQRRHVPGPREAAGRPRRRPGLAARAGSGTCAWTTAATSRAW